MNSSFEPKTQTSKRRGTHEDSQSAIAYPSRTIVHAKLEMTEPGDQDEQEADAVANTVMSGGKIAREISGGSNSSGIAVPRPMESRLMHSQGGGQPMPQGLRSMMEGAFGQDFRQVRLHTDSEAASMSSTIHAKAFTYGNDIFFNHRQFSPETTEGQRLVAHELTHVLQGMGKVGREVDAQETENVIDGDIDHYLKEVGRVSHAVETHNKIDLNSRFFANLSRLFGGEKDFSYKFLYKALGNAKKELELAKVKRGYWSTERRAKVVANQGALIDIVDQRLEMYKNNVQRGAGVNIEILYVTKTVSFAIAASIAGIYFPGILASSLIGGGIGFVDSSVTEISKAANGIESDAASSIASSTVKGMITGGIGGAVGSAASASSQMVSTAEEVILNSSLGVGLSLTADFATKDLPPEKQEALNTDYHDFVMLLSLASDYGIAWQIHKKKFVWESFTYELQKERKFILDYLNTFIKEYPFIIEKFDQLPVYIPTTTYDPDR